MNVLIERIDDYLKNYLGADLARQILRDCKKALEAKPSTDELIAQAIKSYIKRNLVMNKLLESAKDVLYLWDYNGNLFASNHADYTRMEALRQAVNEAERKPVSEPVAWMNPDGSLTPYHKLGEEQEPLYTAPPSIDALIAEIDGLERIDFDEGGCDYPCSDGDNYRFDDVRAVLNKYRGVK